MGASGGGGTPFDCGGSDEGSSGAEDPADAVRGAEGYASYVEDIRDFKVVARA